MSKTSKIKIMETRAKDNHILFFKSQEDFARALREGVGTSEENNFTEEIMEEE